MITYENQSPADIRYGDRVTDSLGRSFWAFSDAEENYGDYTVLGLLDSEDFTYWLILDKDSKVTISYNDATWDASEF